MTPKNIQNNTSQAIWIGISQVSSISLAIINAAILSRYFDKQEYGTYKQILYIYSTLLIFFSAGLHSAYSYFLPKQSAEQGKDFIFKLLKIFFFLGFLFSICLFLAAPLIADLFKNPSLEKGLRIFSIVPAFILPTVGLDGIYSSLRKTQTVALYTTISKIFTLLVVTLPVILVKGSYINAVFGWVIASFLNLNFAVYLILKPYKGVVSSATKFTSKEIFSYSFPLMFATLYGVVIRFADQYFISHYYGTQVFAEFSNGFIDLPFVAVIVNATSTVLVPLFSKYSESETGKDLIWQTWKTSIQKSVLLTYPLLTFFIFNSKNTVLSLYGSQYADSAKYFIVAILIGFFNVILFYPVLLSLGKTKLYSRIHLFQAISIWVFGFICVSFSGNPMTYAVISRLFMILQVGTGIFYALKYTGVKTVNIIPFNLMIKSLIQCSIICFGVKFLTDQLGYNAFFSLLLSGLFSALLIFITGRFFGINYFEIFNSILSNIPGYGFIQKYLKT